jgi:hypothetical protein
MTKTLKTHKNWDKVDGVSSNVHQSISEPTSAVSYPGISGSLSLLVPLALTLVLPLLVPVRNLGRKVLIVTLVSDNDEDDDWVEGGYTQLEAWFVFTQVAHAGRDASHFY